MLALVTTHDADVPVFLRPLDGNSSDKEHLSAAQAYQRLAKWAQDWRERAPKAVATLERDFEQTLVYYSLESVAREWIRTTSLLERTNRQLRRKFRQAVTFGSRKGAEVAIYLQVQRLHAHWTKESDPAPIC